MGSVLAWNSGEQFGRRLKEVEIFDACGWDGFLIIRVGRLRGGDHLSLETRIDTLKVGPKDKEESMYASHYYFLLAHFSLELSCSQMDEPLIRYNFLDHPTLAGGKRNDWHIS